LSDNSAEAIPVLLEIDQSTRPYAPAAANRQLAIFESIAFSNDGLQDYYFAFKVIMLFEAKNKVSFGLAWWY